MADKPQVAAAPSKHEKAEKAPKKFELKTPKGTRDFAPFEMAIREKVFDTITTIYKRHGAVTIDTPVFELKEVLTGKYGEDSKLIYDLADQGGELCALRYDLTVPFARFLAMNKDIKQIKRYHIAKVYRRDNPQIQRGRLREFYQCDFDIAGVYEPMVPDAEVLKIMTEVLTGLEVGEFVIKVNHRKLLDGIFEVAGVPEGSFRAVCSAVDKLDKAPWSEVRAEIINEKHMPEDVADRIGAFVLLKGGRELLTRLSEDASLCADPSKGSLSKQSERARAGIEDLLLLADYLEVLGVKVSFDMSLARGLDYYTGVIYEAVLVGAEVGSVCGGGRYDDLVGMFDSRGHQVPCVGFSIGVERVFAILEAKARKSPGLVRTQQTAAMICTIGEGYMKERMSLASQLWSAGIAAEFSYKRKPKYLDQLALCEKNHIPLVVIFGEDEIKNNAVKVKTVNQRNDKGSLIPISDLVEEVRKRLADPETFVLPTPEPSTGGKK